MRLDEWQKWLDSQFLDAPASAPVKPQEVDRAERPAETASPSPAVEPPVPPPPAAPEASADAPSAAPHAPTRPVPDSPLGLLAEEVEVPSIERYLPFLRKEAPPAPLSGEAAEEAAGEEARATPKAAVEAAGEKAAPVAPEPEPATETPEVHAGVEAVYVEETPALPPDVSEAITAPPGAEGMEPIPGSQETLANREEVDAGEATPREARPVRRFGVSHRRARHARNVRPVEIEESGEGVALWGLVPKHIQVLIAMGSDEVAQNSYRRNFRESRLELIQRLLDPTLSLEDTARLLNVCPTTVRRYTNKGLLTHQRTAGDQRRFKLSDVLAFLEAQSQARPKG